MGFPLVPKSVTLNDPERRNGCVVCVYFAEFGIALGPYSCRYGDAMMSIDFNTRTMQRHR